MTKNVQSHVQVADLGFLQKVYRVRFLDKVRSCEIRKTLILDPLTSDIYCRNFR